MLNRIAFSLVLIVAATASALGTQLALSTNAEGAATLAAKADRLVPAGCDTATWPEIPARCLSLVDTRQIRVIAFGV
jgi:hypothetical protein